METEFIKAYVDDETPNHIDEVIDSSDDFSFTYRGEDYYLENRYGFGWIIVEPKSFRESGGYAENPPIAYPYHGVAKTPEELKILPFLDGKNLFERFDELEFFDY